MNYGKPEKERPTADQSILFEKRRDMGQGVAGRGWRGK